MSIRVDFETGKEILFSHWKEILSKEHKNFIEDSELFEAIKRSINSKTKSYRYAILTQVLAKATNSSVDCRCTKAKRGGPGAFSARPFCVKVIVDFDKRNDLVLGGSGDPYVGNPLRPNEISEINRNGRGDKDGWDDLCLVINRVEEKNNPDFTRKVLDQTLLEIKRRLETIKVDYPTPSRISIDESHKIVMEYLSEPSEGSRLEVIAYSFFKTFGEISIQYDKISHSKTTASNHSMGRVADIECYLNGKRVKAVELKDRKLTKKDMEESLLKIRESEVKELIFVTTKGVIKKDMKEIECLIGSEFDRGKNVYIIDVDDFSKTMLVLFEEEGRKRFLIYINNVLEDLKYPYEHRRKWADLLGNL